MTKLILFFILSISFSFLCSIWEAVLLSVTPTYIRKLREQGDMIAETLEGYKKDIDRPLSAILSLNTIAHTIGAIGVGAQAGALYGSHSFTLGPVSLTYEALVAGGMTLAILILSEIIPKTIGANYWRRLTPFTVMSLKVIMFILAPLVWMSQLITKSLKNEKNKSVLSRADIHAIAKEGEKHGAIDENESTIIRNLIQLDKLTVRDIMTPRMVMLTADETQLAIDFYNETKPMRFSRIPVYAEDNNEIVGVVLKDDILTALAEDQHKLHLSEMKRGVKFVLDTAPLPELFDLLVEQRTHLAVVVDNFGALVGIVSMEDLFETILGLEITDETDSVENLQKLARHKWNERAKSLGLTTEP